MVKTIILLVHGHEIETGMLIGEVERRLAEPQTDGSVTIDDVRRQYETSKIIMGAYARFNPKNVVGMIAVA